jgi:hypothetical protein
VTHPFHPLHGRELDLVTRRYNWSEDRVYFQDDQGRLRTIPAAWTSVHEEDPLVVLAAGRSPFRASDLVELAAIVKRARR